MMKILFTDQEQKLQLVQFVIEKYSLNRMVRYVCELVGVSRSVFRN